MKMSGSTQVEMSGFHGAMPPRSRMDGHGAGRNEQERNGAPGGRAARSRGASHAGEGWKVHRPIGAPGASAVRGLRGTRSGGARLGPKRPAEQSALAPRDSATGNRDRTSSLNRL